MVYTIITKFSLHIRGGGNEILSPVIPNPITTDMKEKVLHTISDNYSSTNTDSKNAPTETPSNEHKQTDMPIMTSNKNLMIICGPNGVNFEIYSHTVKIYPNYYRKNGWTII